MDQRTRRQFQFSSGYWLLAVAALLLLHSALLRDAAPRPVSHSDLVMHLRGDKLARVELRDFEEAIDRLQALGVTLQLPTEERYLMTRDQLLDRVCVMLGGRAAERAA
jgi:hypothetical protein